jgi:hypothetical protein
VVVAEHVNASDLKLRGGTLLHYAIRDGDVPLTRLLLRIPETVLNKRDWPLKVAFAYANDRFLLELLRHSPKPTALSGLLRSDLRTCSRLVANIIDANDEEAILLLLQNGEAFARP